MSNTTRWVMAIFMIVLGFVAALFSMAILGFTSWGCYKETNDLSLTILYTVMVISVLAGIIPAVLLVRKTEGRFMAVAIAASIVATFAGNSFYVFYNLTVC